MLKNLTPEIIYYIIPILILFIFILLYINQINKIKRLKEKSLIVDKLIETLRIEEALDTNLNNILTVVSSVVEAPSYAIFLKDDRSNSFILKGVRYSTNENMQIGPAYSGLLPYKKETFLMPTSIPAHNIVNSTKLIKEGEVPLIYMPIKEEKAVILMGPSKKVSKRVTETLDDISEKIAAIIDMMVGAEELKKQVKVVVSSERAVKNLSNLFSDAKDMVDVVMRISAKSLGASGGLFINKEDGNFELKSVVGLSQETEELIYGDSKTFTMLNDLIGEKSFTSLSKSNKEFFRIPPYFVASDVEVILIIKVHTEKGNGLAVFLYDNNPEIKDYQIAAFKIMAKRIGDIINNQLKFKELSNSYVDILKNLAKLLDNLSPNTVGYSELMYRYAIVISREMKLSAKEIRDISLAAYLSNIGIIGLSDKILHKKGKYSEIEYEMMKLHADAGASIIEATFGNQQVASYIRHHHERIDGYGYPSGLIGEEIPLGARIIAVVQTFLAKIMGREYRAALAFDKALYQLRSAADSQLDEKVVEAFIGWFEKKRRENAKIRHALGYCWEMRCSPESICVSCPAYKETGKNCWDIQGVNCAEHGSRNCEICFVYTEYLDRIRKVT